MNVFQMIFLSSTFTGLILVMPVGAQKSQSEPEEWRGSVRELTVALSDAIGSVYVASRRGFALRLVADP